MTDKYYKDFGVTKQPKTFLDKQQLANVFKIPKKDKGLNETHFQDELPNHTIQADLLFLPNDKGFRYLLVVVDNGSRKTDAEPLKTKDSNTVLKAFKKIFERGVIKIPESRLEVDPGKEFQGSVSKFFEDKGIHIKVGKPDRHRQQALVERRNQTIGEALWKAMVYDQLETGKVSEKWTSRLRDVIDSINEKYKNYKLPKPKDTPVCEGDSCELLDIGTKVRVMLDAPIEVGLHKEIKLMGRFRKADVRWNPKVRIVKQVLLKPNAPPLYLLDGNDTSRGIDLTAAYTKNQLQVIPGNEERPKKGKGIMNDLNDIVEV